MQRDMGAEASPALRSVEGEKCAVDNGLGKDDLCEGAFAHNGWDSEDDTRSSGDSKGNMRISAQMTLSLFTITSQLLAMIRNPRVRMTFIQQDMRKRLPWHLRRVPREGYAKYESRTYFRSLDTIVEELEEE
ncbi:hypothetical protein B0A52_08762 [Exophiala mesophila]|uniref:Uncharacterized protein n=1 Tax=Exophiala mesophila TaxID=212818 RepID=A0A438MUL4_EXOME|nr:hypothetical protein B0A52_08762 [Exophiala mesophila]